jgi:hypothetical protein
MNLNWIAAGAGIFSLFFFWLCWRNLKRKRFMRSGLHLLLTLATAATAALALALSLHLYTYSRLTAEQSVGKVFISQFGPQQFHVDLLIPDQAPRSFVIDGDEWQLDSRVLKWKGYAQLLGMDALYRLDRLSGRYSDVRQARTLAQTAYDLAEDRSPLDLWAWAQKNPRWLPWVDAHYGSATFLPLADKAEYQISLTQSGLIARPDNIAAKRALTGW